MLKPSKVELKKKAHDFIAKHRTATLATVNKKGLPHAAAVYCIVQPDLSLYFMTRTESRKFANLLNQSSVSMTFTDEPSLQTIQLTGKAERINDIKVEQDIWMELMKLRTPWAGGASMPVVQMFERGMANELAIIKVIPQEMTFASFQENQEGHYKPFFQRVI